MDVVGVVEVVELLTPGGWLKPKPGTIRRDGIRWFGEPVGTLSFIDETGATVVLPINLVVAVRTPAGPAGSPPASEMLDPASAALHLGVTSNPAVGDGRGAPAFIGSTTRR